jgi:hypothetical protein
LFTNEQIFMTALDKMSFGCVKRSILGIANAHQCLPERSCLSWVALRSSPPKKQTVAKLTFVLGRVGAPDRNEKGSNQMPLVQIVVVLIVVGVLLWLVNLIPMQGTIKSILNGVVVVAVVLWLLNIFGIFKSLPHIRIGT